MDLTNKEDKPQEQWWCNTHNRFATHIDEKGKHMCAPNLGGTGLCDVVSFTGIVEIEK